GSAGANILPVAADHIGAYALVGMGAFLVAVIRVPFTALIMVFELTRDYNIVLPLMIANTTSYLLANGLLEGSISEKLAEQDGIHLPGKEDHEILNTLVVEDAMVTEPITLNTTLTAKEAWEGVKDYDFSGYPLVRNGLLDG